MKRTFFISFVLLLFTTIDLFSQSSSLTERLSVADSCIYWPYKKYDSVVNVTVSYINYGKTVSYEVMGYVIGNNDSVLEIITAENLKYMALSHSKVQSVVKIKPKKLLLIGGEKYGFYKWKERISRLFGALWLEEKKHHSLADKLGQLYLTEDYRNQIINDFAALYFDEMLREFCLYRNYERAMVYGEFLSRQIFASFKSFEIARELTRQMQNRVDDFVTLNLPDSNTWINYKNKHSREEQIDFLLQRLKLLNCVQNGQPAGISYLAPQSSCNFFEVNGLNENFWESNSLSVVNPVRELINLQISPLEVKQVVPYLLSEDYIPSYTYHRDFFPERTLHKVSWVVADIVFKTTQQQFLKVREFDTMTLKQKEGVVENILKWCDSQNGKTASEITHEILQKSTKWNEFYPALKRAYAAKEPYLTKLLVARFKDFSDEGFPTEQGTIANYLFLVDTGTQVDVVKSWMDMSDDWVKYWSSLYLLKNSEVDKVKSLNSLAQILEKCDGTTFYPEAMDELLKQGPQGLAIAEEVLLLPTIEFAMTFATKQNMIKKLLTAKSEAAYNFLYDGMLEPASQDGNGGGKYFTKRDACILFVDLLQPASKKIYSMEMSVQDKKNYALKLSQWFSDNFKAYSNGSKNELQLDLVPEEKSYWFVDAAR